jgi:hypothetical protein
MSLSYTRVRRRQTKLLYPNHRLPPWLTEDTTSRSREPNVRGRPTSETRQIGSLNSTDTKCLPTWNISAACGSVDPAKSPWRERKN